jgi:hypothetical protein
MIFYWGIFSDCLLQIINGVPAIISGVFLGLNIKYGAYFYIQQDFTTQSYSLVLDRGLKEGYSSSSGQDTSNVSTSAAKASKKSRSCITLPFLVFIVFFFNLSTYAEHSTLDCVTLQAAGLIMLDIVDSLYSRRNLFWSAILARVGIDSKAQVVSDASSRGPEMPSDKSTKNINSKKGFEDEGVIRQERSGSRTSSATESPALVPKPSPDIASKEALDTSNFSALPPSRETVDNAPNTSNTIHTIQMLKKKSQSSDSKQRSHTQVSNSDTKPLSDVFIEGGIDRVHYSTNHVVSGMNEPAMMDKYLDVD